ncbi:MAG: PepSY domain-containing protein [Firmicutes bacterium]|nr:PepSY domain-containing protein [Bacillota bacterium]
MKNLKSLFETPKRAVITCICAIALLAGIGTVSVFAAGAIAENTSIGTENAQNFAFADAGVDPLDAENVKVKFDFEQGQFVYEVDFTANGTEYEYYIKASDGTVVKKESEIVNAALANAGADTTTNQTASYIGVDSAVTVALAHAGLENDDVVFTKSKQDTDDGTVVYDIEFYTSEYEYDYEINATTGAIMSYSINTLNIASGEEVYISLASAKTIALANAGVAASDASFTKAQETVDDGRTVYEIEFYTSSAKYDYEIDALTGIILEKDVEILTASGNDNSSSTSTTTYIGVDAATAIALADAGVSESDTTFTKARQDTDDGIVVYDIEFYTTGYEYEYEINAATGAIVDKSVETLATSGSTGGASSGSTTTTYIGVDSAKEIALADAGVSSADATFTKAKQDTDDGIVVYDIEFYTTGYEYEYEINAATGAIVDKSVETLATSGSTGGSSTGSTTTTAYISVDEAKAVALADAGVSSANATFTKAKQDTDDGIVVYDIEFYTSDCKYEYEINAATGSVMTFSMSGDSLDWDYDASGSSTSGTYIYVDTAKQIALDDAGVSKSNATFTKVKQDIDDGIVVYDIEFYTTNYEYEYEINAATGAIVSRSASALKSASNSGTSTGTTISVDEAKAIALSHAGYSASQVTFSKAKLDKDDGVTVYEIEFYVGNIEYEYEINAATGAILEYDSEVDD